MASEDIFAEDYEGDASPPSPSQPEPEPGPESQPQSEPVTSSATPEMRRRLLEAEQIIQRNVLWTLGAGVVPVPVFDLLAVVGVQIKMLRELSALYDVPFNEGLTRKAILALLSGLGGVGIGAALAPSLFKFVPVLGTALGTVSVSVFSGAFTHATGRVFVMHFESGGTVLDFDAGAMRAYFEDEFARAKRAVSDLRAQTN